VVKIEGLMREQGADARARGKRLVFIKDDTHDAALALKRALCCSVME
jgi:hypothetical protein